MKMQLAEIAQALNTSCEGDAETVITSVAFDSRKISQGALFVPIKGERDGHDFVGSAIEAGASATLWEAGHPNKPEGIAVLEVADTLKAMQDLARYCHERDLQVGVIDDKLFQLQLDGNYEASTYFLSGLWDDIQDEFGAQPAALFAARTASRIAVG